MSNPRNKHFEAVGSYLRPAELKEARAKFQNNEITAAELRAVEDRLIEDVIKKQKAHGLHYITDGEFRRSFWHLDFMWGFGGVEHIELDHGYQFHGEETTKGSLKLTGKISGENHPFINDFLFVKKFEGNGVKAKDHTCTRTIPCRTVSWRQCQEHSPVLPQHTRACPGHRQRLSHLLPRDTRRWLRHHPARRLHMGNDSRRRLLEVNGWHRLHP